MRFQVTQEMIDAGECSSPRKCAVALALTYQLPLPPGYCYYVYGDTVEIVKNRGEFVQEAALSKSIQNFIGNFDIDRASVSPRSFQI